MAHRKGTPNGREFVRGPLHDCATARPHPPSATGAQKDPAEGHRAIRGRDPGIEALMRNRTFLVPPAQPAGSNERRGMIAGWHQGLPTMNSQLTVGEQAELTDRQARVGWCEQRDALLHYAVGADYEQNTNCEAMSTRLSTNLDDPNAIPYFLWDAPMTVSALKAYLSTASRPEWARMLGKILREARDEDVWVFTTPAEVLHRWSEIAPHLGRRLAFWQFLLGEWQAEGLLAS